MLMPLEQLELNLREFEDCDPKIKKLAAFCNEFLEAVRFTLDKI